MNHMEFAMTVNESVEEVENFRDLYNNAVYKGAETFSYREQVIVTDFGKYSLEFLDTINKSTRKDEHGKS